MYSEKQEQVIRQYLGRMNFEVKNNYVHTHDSVWISNGILTAEAVCINEYGSAYGIGEYTETIVLKEDEKKLFPEEFYHEHLEV